MMRFRGWFWSAACCLVTLPVWAQVNEAPVRDAPGDTRAERLRNLRLEKAQNLQPPSEPGHFERMLRGIQTRVENRGSGMGFYGLRPALGGLKRGSGISGGIVFEPFTLQHAAILRAHLLASLDAYWGIGVAGGRRIGKGTLLAYGRYSHMPEEDVYGLGGESVLEDRTNYRLNEIVLGGMGELRLRPGLATGLRAAYIDSRPGPGQDDDYPNAADVLIDAISLKKNAQHLAIGAWLRLDSRDPPARRRHFEYLTHNEPDVTGMPLATDRGVYAVADAVRYVSLNDLPVDFTRVTLQAQQYIPFRHGHNVFAIREYLAMSHTGDGMVPLYMLPALGGAYTLRGFHLFRFRDRHAAMVNVEYRWQVWLFADLALFADAGQVHTDLNEFSIDDWHSSYGGGVRLRAGRIGIARGDVAWSKEGMQVHLILSSKF